MSTRAEVVEIARTWLATPYRHQASVKGLGVDCVGFLVGVALEAGLISHELAAALPTDYSRQPSGGQLRRAMAQHMTPIPIATVEPGDVCLVAFVVEEQHLVMITRPSPLSIIHCGRQGVVEHRMDEAWRRRITRAYRFRGVQ